MAIIGLVSVDECSRPLSFRVQDRDGNVVNDPADAARSVDAMHMTTGHTFMTANDVEITLMAGALVLDSMDRGTVTHHEVQGTRIRVAPGDILSALG